MNEQEILDGAYIATEVKHCTCGFIPCKTAIQRYVTQEKHDKLITDAKRDGYEEGQKLGRFTAAYEQGKREGAREVLDDTTFNATIETIDEISEHGNGDQILCDIVKQWHNLKQNHLGGDETNGN